MSIKNIYENYRKKINNEKINSIEYEKYFVDKIKNYHLDNFDILYLARDKYRPKTKHIIENVIEKPLYLKGDRSLGDDESIIAGIGMLKKIPVTFIGIDKGNSLEENVKKNFGMPSPQGYRKAIRLMKQAEKFKRPIVTFIDTPGAYPGIEAEKNGQAFAISESIYTMCSLKVPIISVITGEGYSGGALGLSICDHLVMLEHSVFSILSPEGFASILYRDSKKVKEASKNMKFSARDMLSFKICDEIIEERLDPNYKYFLEIYEKLSNILFEKIVSLQKLESEELMYRRENRYNGT